MIILLTQVTIQIILVHILYGKFTLSYLSQLFRDDSRKDRIMCAKTPKTILELLTLKIK